MSCPRYLSPLYCADPVGGKYKCPWHAAAPSDPLRESHPGARVARSVDVNAAGRPRVCQLRA